MGLRGKKWKVCVFLGQQSKQLILNNAFQSYEHPKKACFGPLTLSLIS